MGIASRIAGGRGRRQAEKLGVDPARVPPGQYLTDRFPVLTVGPNPPYDLGLWSFEVFGEVERLVHLSWDQLQALPQKDVTLDIHCVTRWSKLDTEWRGVPVREVLELAQVRPSGTHVLAYCDGATRPTCRSTRCSTTTRCSRTPMRARRSSTTTARRCG